MSINKVDLIIALIDKLHQEHLLVRRVYRQIRDRDLNQIEVTNTEAELFGNTIRGILKFGNPIDDKVQKGLNGIAHFLNQNFIIRLFSYLEVCLPDKQLTTCIEKDLEGGSELWLLKKLRNQFAHTDGTFNLTKESHRNLQALITQTCELSPNEVDEDNFTLSKDKVIGRLVDGSKNYVIAYTSKYPEDVIRH